MENLYGLSGDTALLPESKLVAEYRHQDVDYRSGGATKNKHSDFLMAGADYAPGPKLSGSARLGAEFRQRSGERSTTVPYAEFSGKYDYGNRAFVSGGYVYTLEEASDTARFTDTRINRFFVNVQHPLAATVSASASVNFEPTRLQGRRGQRDVDETNTRLGLGLHYSPVRNCTLSANYDYDHIASDDAFRRLERHRTGVSATFAF
jgi:opacity protein-like surface antigen